MGSLDISMKILLLLFVLELYKTEVLGVSWLALCNKCLIKEKNI